MHLISQQLLTNRGQGQPADEKERVNTQVTSQFKSVDCACLIRIFSCSKVSQKKKKTEARSPKTCSALTHPSCLSY